MNEKCGCERERLNVNDNVALGHRSRWKITVYVIYFTGIKFREIWSVIHVQGKKWSTGKNFSDRFIIGNAFGNLVMIFHRDSKISGNMLYNVVFTLKGKLT